jgi:hypothetical protein
MELGHVTFQENKNNFRRFCSNIFKCVFYSTTEWKVFCLRTQSGSYFILSIRIIFRSTFLILNNIFRNTTDIALNGRTINE